MFIIETEKNSSRNRNCVCSSLPQMIKLVGNPGLCSHVITVCQYIRDPLTVAYKDLTFVSRGCLGTSTGHSWASMKLTG